MNKFLTLIQDELNVLNEQEPMAAPPADPAADVAADPAAAPPAPLPPDVPADPASQAMGDIDLARQLALNLPELDHTDRAALVAQVTPENVDAIRDALNSVLNIYTSPS